MLSPPPAVDKGDEDGLVVFVLDVSGSMCVTSEIPKGFGLFQVQTGGHKSSRMQEEEAMLKEMNPEGFHQYIPGQRRDIQYVSRLDCVQVCVL